jgi:hypothetical protein
MSRQNKIKHVKTKQKQQSNKLGYPCMVFWVSMVHQVDP